MRFGTRRGGRLELVWASSLRLLPTIWCSNRVWVLKPAVLQYCTLCSHGVWVLKPEVLQYSPYFTHGVIRAPEPSLRVFELFLQCNLRSLRHT